MCVCIYTYIWLSGGTNVKIPTYIWQGVLSGENVWLMETLVRCHALGYTSGPF